MANDYGVKVSQLGIDVEAAADQQLINSSGWPNLKIEHTETVTVANGATYTYTHNLGYPPFFLIYDPTGGRTVLGYAPTWNWVTTTTFVINNTSGVSLTFRYYIFRLPLNVQFNAKKYDLSPITAVAKDNDLGIKVMKPGKKYTSTDFRDYTYHSATRSPMVHVVQYQTSVNPGSGIFESTWTNDLGYVPIFFGFIDSQNNGKWTQLMGLEQSPPKLFVDPIGNMKIQTGVGSGKPNTIVVFKDPFAIATAQNVTL